VQNEIVLFLLRMVLERALPTLRGEKTETTFHYFTPG
jgi:hypothetical protein